MRKHIFQWGAAVLVAFVALPSAAQERRDSKDANDQYRHGSNVEVRVAQTAPPRAKHERKPARPDADSVWVAGAWDWQGSQWAWTPGRWDRPEDRSARWVAPRYKRESNAYRYEPGHWSNQQVVEGSEYQQWKQQHGRHSDAKDEKHDHGSSN